MSFDIVSYSRRKALLNRILEDHGVPGRYAGFFTVVFETHSAGRFSLASSLCRCLCAGSGRAPASPDPLRLAMVSLMVLGGSRLCLVSARQEAAPLDEGRSLAAITETIAVLSKA